MQCTQFRESLDPYLDGELAPAAAAAAHLHRRNCQSCDAAATRLEAIKRAVKQTVTAAVVPPGLEARVRAATGRRWLPSAVMSFGTTAGRSVLAVAALALFAVLLSAPARS